RQRRPCDYRGPIELQVADDLSGYQLRRVIDFGGANELPTIPAASDQDPSRNRSYLRRSKRDHLATGGQYGRIGCRHIAGCTEGSGNWIEEFCTGRAVETSPGDQHLAAQEKGGVMAIARRHHIAGGCEGPGSLRA